MKKSTIQFLTILKNATLIRKESFAINVNKQIFPLLNTFYSIGLIQSFYVFKETKVIRIFLRYTVFGNPFSNLKIFSTATKNFVYTYSNICRTTSKRKLFLFSTNFGLLTLLACKKLKKGGKLYLSFF